MGKTALIAGASGMVGGHVLRLLLEDPDYSGVTSIGRRSLDIENDKLRQVTVDFDRLADWGELFEADHIYCCLGTTIKKAGTKQAFERVDKDYPLAMGALAADGNAMAFSIVTAMGSNARSMIFYNRVKGEVEEGLEKSGIPAVSVLQPSLLLGEREENRLGERIAQHASKFTSGLMLGPLKKYRAIEGLQVARAMVAITKEERRGFIRYPNDELLLF
jgi:uncharacterized protein YbjT (DUF2867 family)